MVAESSLKAAEDATPEKGKTKKGKARAKEIEKEAEQASAVQVRQEERRVAVETVRAYKEAEAAVWTSYATWLVSLQVSSAADEKSENFAEEEAMGVRLRACRACPQSAGAWTDLLSSMVRIYSFLSV